MPWVVVLRGGQSPRDGHYPVFLFARDGSAAFLSLNQTTEQRTLASITAETDQMRTALGLLPDQFVRDIDLRATTGGPKKYETGNVAAVRYDSGSVPADAEIAADLDRVIEWSDQLQTTDVDGGGLGSIAVGRWIFQSSPERYDITSALDGLAETTWLVNQYQHQIHAGHRVYLYETGPKAAIAAIATILAEPAELEASPEEEDFFRTPEAFAGSRLRVPLRIDDVLTPRVSRDALLAHPKLANLPNLKFANATNYPLTDEQDEALRELIAGTSEARVADRMILKVAPGRNAEIWDDCVERGYIAVGWDEVGDLRAFESRNELVKKFREEYPERSPASGSRLWLLRNMLPGDLVIANRGTREILGVGRVIGPGYEWSSDR